MALSEAEKARIPELVGVWEVEGSRFAILPLENGVRGVSEFGRGTNPGWILLRGRKLSNDPSDLPLPD